MEASATQFNEEQVQTRILQILKQDGSIGNTIDLANELKISHADLDKVLKSLLVDEYIKLEVIEKKLIELTAEGKDYIEKGTPEF
jgi:DNA-binding MarR family transcriptional regulator